MKKKIYDIVFSAQYQEISTKEATDQLLVLFGIVEQSEQFTCKHCGTHEKRWSMKNDDWYCKTCGHICR